MFSGDVKYLIRWFKDPSYLLCPRQVIDPSTSLVDDFLILCSDFDSKNEKLYQWSIINHDSNASIVLSSTLSTQGGIGEATLMVAGSDFKGRVFLFVQGKNGVDADRWEIEKSNSDAGEKMVVTITIRISKTTSRLPKILTVGVWRLS
jgi:hypothetical protein